MLTEDPRAVIDRTLGAIVAVGGADEAARTAADARQARLTKPPGALGRLEELAGRLAGITGAPRPRLERRLVVVAAGDHGVTAQGVSAYPSEVTAQMMANFLAGGAAINVLASHAGARVRIVDAGVRGETPAHPDLVRLRLGPGTEDISRGPAMPRVLAERAVAEGIALFEAERAAAGVDIVACGDMGIGNTTSAAAIVAAVSGLPAGEVTGRGTGVDDAALMRKVEVIARALEVNRPDARDGLGLLAALGGFEIGVLAGVYLGAAATRTPAVIDGVISAAAALVARCIAPEAEYAFVASHRSAEPGHGAALGHLRLEPLLDLGMRLGEGTGAVLGISLCVAACRLLDEMATFEEAGVSDAGGGDAGAEAAPGDAARTGR